MSDKTEPIGWNVYHGSQFVEFIPYDPPSHAEAMIEGFRRAGAQAAANIRAKGPEVVEAVRKILEGRH